MEHIFNETGICKKCGRSREAISYFNWVCGENVGPDGVQLQRDYTPPCKIICELPVSVELQVVSVSEKEYGVVIKNSDIPSIFVPKSKNLADSLKMMVSIQERLNGVDVKHRRSRVNRREAIENVALFIAAVVCFTLWSMMNALFFPPLIFVFMLCFILAQYFYTEPPVQWEIVSHPGRAHGATQVRSVWVVAKPQDGEASYLPAAALEVEGAFDTLYCFHSHKKFHLQDSFSIPLRQMEKLLEKSCEIARVAETAKKQEEEGKEDIEAINAALGAVAKL